MAFEEHNRAGEGGKLYKNLADFSLELLLHVVKLDLEHNHLLFFAREILQVLLVAFDV